MTSKKKKLILLAVAFFLLIALVFWIIWGNTALELNSYTVSSDKLPESFSGFRIAHVSDFHNAELDKRNKTLLNRLKSADPDLIAITGDFIDSRNTKVEIALQFAEEAVTIAPCYYIAGNHESRVAEYEELKQSLIQLGVIVLENERIELEHNGDFISLIGIRDPSFETKESEDSSGKSEAIVHAHLQETVTETDGFRLVLSHRPELFDVYVTNKVNLVLSGHAHGGQFRLPFVGGLFAPSQGLFPKYDAGLYTEGSTNMVVSRGIGNSLFPFRVNNRPELILITLQSRAS